MKLFFVATLTTFLILSCAKQAPKPVAKRTSSGNGIIGGNTLTDPDQAISIVRVNYKSGRFCSGAFIGGNKILTAAHCLSAENPVSVLFSNSVACQVLTAVPHPGYRPASYGFLDFGVLKISCRNFDTSKVPPFVLADKSDVAQNFLAAGFGFQDLDKTQGNRLNWVAPRPLDFEGPGYKTLLNDHPGWATAMAKDVKDGSITCFQGSPIYTVFLGDSGGPVYTYLNRELKIFGVISKGIILNENMESLIGSCHPLVTSARDWILAQ